MVNEFSSFARRILKCGMLVAALTGMPLPAAATQMPVPDDSVASMGSVGPAIIQTFLDTGASVVRTNSDTSCVVSARILIEESTYVDTDGTVLDFARIRRSPATSIQAIAPETGDLRFRIQLKYSPRADRPIRMTFGDIDWDLSDVLEDSTDSLSITGERAAVLAAAFRAGLRPQLVAVSRDNDHVVTDRIEVPDLNDLAACKAELKPDAAQVPSTLITMRFQADPVTSPLATLGELQDCRMADEPGELHVAKISQTTGFFSQTDKVFVAFDRHGKVSRAYVPGIFDGDFRNGRRDVRISIAANSNVPMEPNAVKGCLGLAPVAICSYDSGDQRYLGVCEQALAALSTPEKPEVPSLLDSVGPNPFGGFPKGGDVIITGGVTPTPTPITPKPPGRGPKTPITDLPPAPQPPQEPEPSPVPVPSSALLMLGGLALMAGLRRRKAR